MGPTVAAAKNDDEVPFRRRRFVILVDSPTFPGALPAAASRNVFGKERVHFLFERSVVVVVVVVVQRGRPHRNLWVVR